MALATTSFKARYAEIPLLLLRISFLALCEVNVLIYVALRLLFLFVFVSVLLLLATAVYRS